MKAKVKSYFAMSEVKKTSDTYNKLKNKIKVTEKDPEPTEEQKDQISKERNKSFTSRFTRALGFKTATETALLISDLRHSS